MHGDDLRSRFLALDAFLVEHEHLWRPKPFTVRTLPWEGEHPVLAQWLRQRTLEDAEAAHNHPEQLEAPEPFRQIAARSRILSAVNPLPTHSLDAVSSRMSVDVPGRKWQQIEAFARCLEFQQAPTHWLDWCAGKGHLGRRLAHSGASLTCLEYDAALVEAGSQLSRKLGTTACHLHQDVMADDTASRLQATHSPVALHACGDLHIRLMHLASDAHCQHMAIAPCCYNRIAGEQYRPLSSDAQASGLTVSVDDLGLPLSETVTAGARVRRQRDESMARRLAFDLLQRQLRGVDDYLPTPSLPSAWLAKPFADYCRDLASLKQLPAPGPQDWPTLEANGWQRLAQVRNLELLRNLFRRPLELWLILDRALYLQERDYQVRIGTFCDTQVTPRNMLILAERK